MIYELRTYTVKPGTLGDMVKAASTVSADIRKNDYGKLEGYWMTEIGPLNQVLQVVSEDYENASAVIPISSGPSARQNRPPSSERKSRDSDA